MSDNSRGLCPSCGGSDVECCGGKLHREFSAKLRAAESSRINALELASEQMAQVTLLEAQVARLRQEVEDRRREVLELLSQKDGKEAF